MSKESKDPCVPCRTDINIDDSKWDQNTYMGRAKHFFAITNPFYLLTSGKELERCRTIVQKYRNKEKLPECITEEELWRCKHKYDSAFHPETGEKMNLIGRMSAQVPMNTLITGCMMTFYKSMPAVVFWQWFNQSFNALVNYTNRSGGGAVDTKTLLTSYALATTGAVGTALTLNHLAKSAPPIVSRFVPFTAVCAANMINIPMMRSQELINGITIHDERDRKIGYSKSAAVTAISTVVISRILMAVPGMTITPVIMHKLESKSFMKAKPWLNLPIQCGIVALCLTFATPLCCALFKQQYEVKLEKLEPEIQEYVKTQLADDPPKALHYNKGL